MKISNGTIYSIAIIVFLAFGIHTGIAAASVSVPTINVAPLVHYSLDEMLYIEGRADAGVEVELFFEKSGSQPVRVSVDTNSNGEWFFGERLELTSGEWTVRARAVDNPDISDWSNPRIIRSVVSGFTIGSVKVKYVPVILTLLSLFVLGVIFLVYSITRARKVRQLALEQEMHAETDALAKRLHEKESEDTRAFIERSFSDIRRDIMEEIQLLEDQVRSGKTLSKEEEKQRRKLFQDLREAEEAIEKRIDGVM